MRGTPLLPVHEPTATASPGKANHSAVAAAQMCEESLALLWRLIVSDRLNWLCCMFSAMPKAAVGVSSQ